MANTKLTIEQVLTLLAATPRRIGELTAGVAPARLRTRPSEDEWSANEVLAHLRACADVRGGAILTILTEDTPTIRAVDPRRWMREQTDYPDLDFRRSLRAFAKQRADLLAVLEALGRRDWSRGGRVTGAGKALERDVLSYGEWVAVHERPHLKQIERTLDARSAP